MFDFVALSSMPAEAVALLWCCCEIANWVHDQELSGFELPSSLSTTRSVVEMVDGLADSLVGLPHVREICDKVLSAIFADPSRARTLAAAAFVLASYCARLGKGSDSRMASRLVDLSALLITVYEEEGEHKTGDVWECSELSLLPGDAAVPALKLVLTLLRGGGRPRRLSSSTVSVTSCLTTSRLLRIAATCG
jgi:hypothetical protein